jgi:hypothetical protein
MGGKTDLLAGVLQKDLALFTGTCTVDESGTVHRIHTVDVGHGSNCSQDPSL